ncbi:unnamed protein product [Zymoseptoria tritici ST99CH_1A5]|uniref:Uncharacterized protein n=1 Tax=Zymoseptoria tritici ST99CH_1A5 TaxID=1276529 RepID=A0A1Y6LPY1_ZYMTR|nr:unnamed protein product [Zymoseptoria tritici ST99CH_3D1]SMY25699.1 unnamed protein product [Zymoseptoria tritici ST99CH_1A5]
MDNYRKQIAGNLRIACPSIALGTHTTEIVVTRRQGRYFACVCGVKEPYQIYILARSADTISQAMDELLVKTTSLVELKLDKAFTSFAGGHLTYDIMDNGGMLRSVSDEARGPTSSTG